MDAKTQFGMDYFQALMEMNSRSIIPTVNSATVAKLLLILEWGFTTDDVDRVNKEFWERNQEFKLDDFNVAITRLLSYLKEKNEAKTKLLTDLILVAGLDDNISEQERALMFAVAEEFDLRKSEVLSIADSAENIKYALDWFVKTYKSD